MNFQFGQIQTRKVKYKRRTSLLVGRTFVKTLSNLKNNGKTINLKFVLKKKHESHYIHLHF